MKSCMLLSIELKMLKDEFLLPEHYRPTDKRLKSDKSF